MTQEKAAISAAFFCLVSVLATTLVKLMTLYCRDIIDKLRVCGHLPCFCGVHEVKNPWKGKP